MSEWHENVIAREQEYFRAEDLADKCRQLEARVAELEAERDRIAADAAAFQAEADDWRRMAGRLREALRILDGFVEPAPTSSQWRAICAKAAELKEALR